MKIFSTFEHSMNLELAISALHLNGIKEEQIYAVPLTSRKEKRTLLDSMHKSDGVSLVSTGAALGTALSVIGASIGFRLTWGPIYWGLIGAAGGFLIGLIIDLVIHKAFKNNDHHFIKGTKSEVILIVECSEEQSDQIEHVLWHHFAIGTARVS